MDLGKIFFSALSGDGGVTEIAGQRIYPGVIPQEIDRPCISYDIGSLPGIDGTAPIYSPTVTVSCFAREKTDAHALSSVVDGVLEGLTGQVAGVQLKSTFKSSYQEGFDPDMDVFAVVLTYTTMIVLVGG